MMLRAVRRAGAVRQRHGLGRHALASVAAAGAVAGAVSGPAHAESDSGRWGWPSWLPSTPGLGSSAAERAYAPPPLSPGPQTSQPVFNNEKMERMRLARIRQYEEDIRKLSTAEKVFTYFASSANDEGAARMTPQDLLRAMVSCRYAMQRSSPLPLAASGGPPAPYPIRNLSDAQVGSHLDASVHGALVGDGNTLTGPALEFVKLVDVDGDGFISLPEFLLLTTLLTIPPTQLKVAFRMFDVENNGVRRSLQLFSSAAAAVLGQAQARARCVTCMH
eukprot:COSAG02_NODE_161_length_32629_cov_10.363142_21_plen_276_part_00